MTEIHALFTEYRAQTGALLALKFAVRNNRPDVYKRASDYLHGKTTM